jgi:hypothetical protein
MFVTFTGWLLGVAVVLVLAALGDLVHFGGESVVGIGMGLSVGCAQWLSGRKLFGATTEWMWASAVGLGAPFVIWDLLRLGGDTSLYIVPAVGGLLVGLWQRRTLRSRSARAKWWIPASAAGWWLAAVSPLALVVGGRPNSLLELIRNLAAIALGGVVLGIVTGAALAWVLPRNTAAQSTPL